WLRARGRLYDHRLFHRVVIASGPLGFLAILLGWTTTEVGRQPFIIYGLMRTADGASVTPGSSIAVSLALFVVTYTVVFGVGAWYILRLMRAGPAAAPSPPSAGGT